MRFDLVGDTLVVNTQNTPYSPQIYAVYIHLDSFLTEFFSIGKRLFVRSIFEPTQIAPVALTARWVFTNFVLLDFAVTFWTFHTPILPNL
jgi:hypothetical protein